MKFKRICYDVVIVRAATLNEKLMHPALTKLTNAVKITLTLGDPSLHCLLNSPYPLFIEDGSNNECNRFLDVCIVVQRTSTHFLHLGSAAGN